MKVVIAHRSGEPRVIDLPEPQGGRNFVTVRVSHSAVRFPDELEFLDKAGELMPDDEDGFPLGGCASGTVLAVGEGVQSIKSGIRVAVTGQPYVYHAGSLVVPEQFTVELPKKVNQEEGAWTGLGAAVLQLFRSSGVQLGENVLIFGADMPGFLLAQIARAAGAIPILVEESEFRVKKAGTLGIAHATGPDLRELVRLVDSVTDGLGADAAFVMRRDDIEAFNLGQNLLRRGGSMILGAPMERAVSLDTITDKGLRIVTARQPGDAPGARWTHRDNMGCFCQLLAERKVQVTPLVTERIPLERAASVYEKARRNRDNALGVVFTV